LASLHAGRWLQSNSILVAESARDENIPSTDNYALVDERLYGDTRIAFLRPSNPEET
jgi:16S rRNA G966 N2-methylase RsmD